MKWGGIFLLVMSLVGMQGCKSSGTYVSSYNENTHTFYDRYQPGRTYYYPAPGYYPYYQEEHNFAPQ
jgi:hypothetical protein